MAANGTMSVEANLSKLKWGRHTGQVVISQTCQGMKLSQHDTTGPCYLFEVRKCKKSPLVDCNLEAFIIDHGPVTPVSKLVNSHIRILQVDTQLSHNGYCDMCDIKIMFMHRATDSDLHKFILTVWNMSRLSQQEIKKRHIMNCLMFCTLWDFGFLQQCCWNVSLLGFYTMLNSKSYRYFWRSHHLQGHQSTKGTELLWLTFPFLWNY